MTRPKAGPGPGLPSRWRSGGICVASGLVFWVLRLDRAPLWALELETVHTYKYDIIPKHLPHRYIAGYTILKLCFA